MRVLNSVAKEISVASLNEFLSPKRLNEMSAHLAAKTELEKQLKVLLARAEQIDADLSAEPDDDWEERATELENSDTLDTLGQATIEEIKQIKYALRMIESGKYGVCNRCGKEIAAARLKAVPHAVTCVNC